jgi:hypothetical protein
MLGAQAVTLGENETCTSQRRQPYTGVQHVWSQPPEQASFASLPTPVHVHCTPRLAEMRWRPKCSGALFRKMVARRDCTTNLLCDSGKVTYLFCKTGQPCHLWRVELWKLRWLWPVPRMQTLFLLTTHPHNILVSVICNQPRSDNIKWKIPEINNFFSLTFCALLSSMVKSHTIPPGSWILPLSSISMLHSHQSLCLCYHVDSWSTTALMFM